MPRGRSFHGSRNLTPAQAAQDGFHHRLAAKMLAEKKKKAVAAQSDRQALDTRDVDKEAEPTDVINITVDAKGVMIDSAKGTTQGMGGRSNSRSRMTRSTSKSRNSFRRADDKENITADVPSFKAVEADVAAYFGRKRSVDLSRRKRDTENDNLSSWDGSMPKRQSSRSFIDRKVGTKTSATQNGEAEARVMSLAPPSDTDVNDRPRRRRSQKLAALKKSLEEEGTKIEALKQQFSAVDLNGTYQNNPSDEDITGKQNSQTTIRADARLEAQANTPLSGIRSLQAGGCVKIRREMNAGNEAISRGVHSVRAEECPDRNGREVPASGKWCDDCAGLGLHIAALLSQLDKARSTTDSSSEGSSSSCNSKKGWKSMVTQTMLGDSKSKSSTEKARLQQEINVLKATVDFLYKKVETLGSGRRVGEGSAS